MRIAALADIHGNLGALEALVEDLERTRPDIVVNLGDCLSGPLQPRGLALFVSCPTLRLVRCG
ncbi:putative phosphoesterase [Bosea sp. LC85]|uniref:metallophosphoesterase family protein n=1 Tax=Bosea sp. LC85 TaxID=1502851 RepID=UPI0004E31A97|nr:putative phosphoesterase [Bosea sp. LC85]